MLKVNKTLFFYVYVNLMQNIIIIIITSKHEINKHRPNCISAFLNSFLHLTSHVFYD